MRGDRPACALHPGPALGDWCPALVEERVLLRRSVSKGQGTQRAFPVMMTPRMTRPSGSRQWGWEYYIAGIRWHLGKLHSGCLVLFQGRQSQLDCNRGLQRAGARSCRQSPENTSVQLKDSNDAGTTVPRHPATPHRRAVTAPAPPCLWMPARAGWHAHVCLLAAAGHKLKAELAIPQWVAVVGARVG